MAKYQMKRLLDAREADVLQHQTPLTVQDLESYAENTASQLLYLQLAAAGTGCVLHVVVGSCQGHAAVGPGVLMGAAAAAAC
jgi:NADH dehydrogenase [ubiquinone] 1 alpha subcomplex assembly factor 6